MPTRLRVDLAGYHHNNVFNNKDDKEMFLQIVNKIEIRLY